MLNKKGTSYDCRLQTRKQWFQQVFRIIDSQGVRNTYGFVEGNSDQTDISKDRIFSTQSIVTSEEFSRAVLSCRLKFS